MELGELKRLDPREVWKNEASDFTPWLGEHLEQLGEALGLELDLKEREAEVGDFSIDLLAHDLGRERLVVIENQLEPTDHTHLGQLITYAAGMQAGAVVWVCREFRDEHRRAIDWLNQGMGGQVDFFGVVVEVLQVDGSRPAIVFRAVAAPTGWRRSSSSQTKEVSDKGARYQQFFQRLLDELRVKHRFTNAKAGQPQSWYSFSTGTRGLQYSFSFASGGRLRAELYIDAGEAEVNAAILDRLRSDKAAIEAQFGESLSWEDLDSRRACRIACYGSGSIEDPQDTLDEHLAWAVQKLLLFKRVFGPRLPSAAAAPVT